jgi:hypothetical protein
MQSPPPPNAEPEPEDSEDPKPVQAAIVAEWRDKLSADCYYCRVLGLETGGGPNAHMLERYLGQHTTPCDRRCCHACQCAEILCMGCRTHMERTARFVCMHPDCTPGQPDPSTYGYRICERCFANPDIMHPCPLDVEAEPTHHHQFCKVTPDGEHAVATRTIKAGEIRELQISDFPLLVGEAARADCPICMESDGDDGAGLATNPNCSDPSHETACRPCLLASCQNKKVHVYRGVLADKPPTLFCSDCHKAAPIVKFREELLELHAAVEAAFPGSPAASGSAEPAEPVMSALREALAAQGVPAGAVTFGGESGSSREELDQQLAAAVKAVHLDQADRYAVVDEVFAVAK